MFVGESGCWIIVAIFALAKRASRSRGYTAIPNNNDQDESNAASKPLIGKDSRKPLTGTRVFLLAIPSTCDIIGTTLMNGGFLFVAASIYQMTRGALVLFVGLFSVIFLKRHLFIYQWLALVIVFAGVGLVGIAGSFNHHIPDEQQQQPSNLLAIRESISQSGAGMVAIGISMIAGAQIFTATQFVLEEFILERYSIEPLRMVGYEGLFGFLVTALGMIILHILIGRSHPGGPFDALTGLRQMTSDSRIALTSILIMISIGGFNFFGLSVTRTVSATSRSTIDTCRTLFIWIFSLASGWERLSSFTVLQVVGFGLLVYGTFLFNNIVGAPWACCVRRRVGERVESPPRLLVEEPVEHH